MGFIHELPGSILRVDQNLFEKSRKRIQEFFEKSTTNLNIKFVKAEDTKIIGEVNAMNQVIVLFKNGEWRVFNKKMNGNQVKEALGPRWRHVRMWSYLPTRKSDANPCSCGKNFGNDTSDYQDLYDLTHATPNEPRD